MDRRLTRRDFIHQLSATLGLLGITYRSVGIAPPPMPARAQWVGEAFAVRGELPALQKLAMDALTAGESDEAFDWVLATTSLVDAPTPQYRDALVNLRSVCLRTERSRAATTLDWYLRWPVSPLDGFDSGWTWFGSGDLARAAEAFDSIGATAHAAFAHERAGDRGAARERYTLVAAKAGGLARALAGLAAARLASPSPARDRAMDVALEHARRALQDGTPSRADIANTLDERVFEEDAWKLTMSPEEDRFRFVVAPPWIQPILDDEVSPDIPALCAPLLVHRSRLETRVTPLAADFVLRRWMVTRLLALELATARDERASVLLESLRLRAGQLGDERVTACVPAAPAWEWV